MPQDAPTEYRGFPVPPKIRQFFYNTSGRYWRKGIDTVLDSDAYKQMEEYAWRYESLNK